MCKGGQPTQTNTVQNQNVAYTPTGLQGFQNIYNAAAQVASTPYQPYTGQLVAGLNPTQTGAISNISNIAGSPLSNSQIQQYMNPFQSDVINATMANINETNAQQQAQTTGQLNQAAGGLGASRIAIGQSELARQQALASNQTLAGLNQQNYQQGLAAAQQQQGFGLGAAQTQLGAGSVAQQTSQAGLTAAYQQYLQQLAFPYQQVQFLAGVGLPALSGMGGQQYQTGTANQTITPPGISPLQAISGLGALGYGAYQGFNQNQARGGRIHYDDGGGIGGSIDDRQDNQDDPDRTIDLNKDEYQDQTQEDQALAPVLSDKGYIPTGQTQEVPSSKPTPMAPMQTQSGQSGGSSGSSNVMTGLLDAGKLVGSILALKKGGRVGYDDGGTIPQQGGATPGTSGMAFPSPAMLGRPLTQGALPSPSQINNPSVFYGQQLPNMLPASPVVNPQAQNQTNLYQAARAALQEQQLGRALAQFRNQASGDDDPRIAISTREYARGGDIKDSPSDAAHLASMKDWDQDRDFLQYKLPDRNVEPITPGQKMWDPQGLGRDVRQMADGGDADDFSDRFGAWPATNPIDTYSPEVWQPGDSDESNPYSNSAYPLATKGDRLDSIDAPRGDRLNIPDAIKGDRLDIDPQAQDSAYPQMASMSRSVPVITVNKPSPQMDADSGTYAPTAPTDISAAQAAYPRVSQPGGGFDPDTASSRDLMNLQNYKDQVATRPTVRSLANDPSFWIRAGLGILAADPSHGGLSAIGQGAGAALKTYDQFSREDLSSKQKAMELAAKLKEHSDQYTKMTANEQARIQIEHERLAQGHYQAVNFTDSQGRLRAGKMNTKTGQITDNDNNPADAQAIYGRGRYTDPNSATLPQLNAMIARYRANHPNTAGMTDQEVGPLAVQEAKSAQGALQGQSLPPRPAGATDAQLIQSARQQVQAHPETAAKVKQTLQSWGVDTSGL